MSPADMPTYENPALPIKERVANLVSQMTLEEKILQMVYDAPAIERLGIPAYNWWNECLHGVGRSGVATVFPQAIGLAATWDTELMGQVAVAIADEGRAKYHQADRQGIGQIYTGLTFWSPNVNIFRDPRWGRGQETYGEDPYLAARMGVVFVRGLQGEDATHDGRYLKLVATPKHYAVHSGPERLRHRFDATVDERDLRSTYLPAFEACVKEGGAVSIMGAYNRVNGEPACASPTLLQKILRQEWGFGGPDEMDAYVVSDCWAIIDLYAHHQVVDTPEEAAALAVKNGCDLNCGSSYPALSGAVKQGLISEEDIDLAVTRLFTARFRLGMFDPPDQVSYAQTPYEIINAPQHQALALRAARESMVLLKNEDGLLPLPRELKSIAVVGPNADRRSVLLGNYNGTPTAAVTPLEGIRKKILPSTKLYYAQGCGLVDGVPPLEVIPSAFLRPVEADAGVTGLTAAIYANADHQGVPDLVRVDRAVDFIWKGTTPLARKWGEKFSIRWKGYLVPPVSGTYRVGVDGFSRYKLYLDGKLLVEHENMHQPILRSREVDLEGDRFYPLNLEYASRGLDPQARLLWTPPDIDYEAPALEAAAKSDLIVAVMGLSPRLEGEEMPVQVDGFSGGDRTRIELPLIQDRLLKKLNRLGKPLVLVLLNGSALAIPWAAEQIPAIVEAWYPGQSGGDALADVLFGDYNPGGRLPVTFYRGTEDLPPFEDYAMAGRTYRYFGGEPLFPFGHGLSYTRFLFDNLQINPGKIQAGDRVRVSCEITNTGERSGDEVVQLYIRHSQAPMARKPLQELRGFARITLESGETKRITFVVHTDLLAIYDEDVCQVVQPGPVDVMVGNSSRNLLLTGKLAVTGQPSNVGRDKTFFSIVQIE